MQWLRRAFVTIKGLPLSEQNDNQLLSVPAAAAALTPAAAATGAPGVSIARPACACWLGPIVYNWNRGKAKPR